jgi:predicted aspartyl protease
MLPRRLFLAGLCAVPFAAQARERVKKTLRSQQTPVAPVGPDANTLPVTNDKLNRLTLPVTVNGHGPYEFMVDTAAERSVLSREIAEQLKLPVAGAARLHGIAGVEPVEMLRDVDLGFGELHKSGLDPLLVPRHRLEIDGVLGLDALDDRCVVLDYGEHLLTITETRWRRPGSSASRGEAVIEGLSRLGQLTFVDAHVDGVLIYAFIDSGAQSSIGNLALAKAIDAFLPTIGRDTQPVPLQGATGQVATAQLGRANKFQLGPIEFRSLELLFSNLHVFDVWGLTTRPALLVGGDLLRMFETVELDFGSRQLRVRRADAGRTLLAAHA